jgi:hypothetical protein
MPLRLPEATRNAKADAAVDRIDLGSGSAQGELRIYSGTQPASADDAPAGDLLVTVELNQPAFGAASSGAATLDTSGGLSGVGTAAAGAGTNATWGRVVNRDAATVLDGHVTVTGGGGVFTLDNISIAEDQVVNLTGGTYTQPAS